jgi:hypothetical protein
MSGTELDQFRKRTRWVYYREGVAYGPFSVDEILDMIEEGVLSRDTELMELGSNRRIPLGSVSIFLDRARKLDERLTREMDEAEFEGSRQRLGRSRGVQFYLVNIALPAVLVCAVVLGIFWKQIFGAGGGEDPGAIHVAVEGQDEGAGDEATQAQGKSRAAEVEFVEADSPLEAGLEDYALGLTMEGADDGSLAALSAAPTAIRAKKLPSVIAVERKAPARRKPVKAAATGGGPAAVTGEAIVEMDFSDEEIGVEDDAPGGDDVEDMVRRRLRPVLRSCASKADTGTGAPPDVEARVKVRPTGSLGSLKLTVEPQVGYSEIRMCVIAGMAGIRVPPFDGDARQVTTTN